MIPGTSTFNDIQGANMTASPNIMLEAALRYAALGKRVLPLYEIQDGRCACGAEGCKSPGKHPRNHNGATGASKDEAQIRKWWQQWPNANIGVATGDQFWVLDIDPRHGGNESLMELIHQHGMLPETIMVDTGGCGRHYYFKVNGVPIINATGISPGIDVKAIGGYIVAPPSNHISGNRYVVAPGSAEDFAEAPAWLLAMVTTKPATAKKPFDTPSAFREVPRGKQHATLVSLAGKYRYGNFPYEIALDGMLKAGRGFNPAVSDKDTTEILDDIYGRYPAGPETTVDPSWSAVDDTGAPQPDTTAEAMYGADDDNSSSDLWPDPAPLGNELPPVNQFNEELLPISFRSAAKDIAERMQVSLDYPATAQICTLAGAVNRRAEIQPKANDNTWTVKPNLWGGIIAPPGFMKTPTLESATRLLRKIEDEYRIKFDQESLDFQRAKELWDLQKNAYRQSATQAYKKNQTLPQEVGHPPEEPKQIRFIINDATFESLHEIMAVNPAGIFVVRDELSGFLAQLDRPGREGERAFYLQAWNGDTGHTIDRIGRGSIHVSACCVSMLGGIQPNKLKAYFADTLRGGPTDDGLIQRFQLLVWPDPPSGWILVDRPPDSAALKQVETILQKLVKLDAEFPLGFRFSAEAQELFYAWLAVLEAKVRSEDIHPALAGHLSKFRKTMPALALLFELADRAADPGFDGFVASLQGDFEKFGEVSLQHAQQAAAFCDYLESHARRVYACVITPQLRAAQVLASKIKTKKVGADGVFSLREVYLKGWSGLDTPELAQGAAGILQDAGWIRPVNDAPGPQGGRPSMRYEINPKVWK